MASYPNSELCRNLKGLEGLWTFDRLFGTSFVLLVEFCLWYNVTLCCLPWKIWKLLWDYIFFANSFLKKISCYNQVGSKMHFLSTSTSLEAPECLKKFAGGKILQFGTLYNESINYKQEFLTNNAFWKHCLLKINVLKYCFGNTFYELNFEKKRYCKVFKSNCLTFKKFCLALLQFA